MTSSSSARQLQRHPPVRPQPQYRRRRPRRPVRHQRCPYLPAHQSSFQPLLPQGQPGRRADHDPRPLTSNKYDMHQGLRPRLDHPRPRSSPRSRRRPGRSPAAAPRLRSASKSTPRSSRASASPSAASRASSASRTPTSRAASSPTAAASTTSSPTTRSPTPPTTSRLIVGFHNGAAVRLSDVADVVDCAQEPPHRRLLPTASTPSPSSSSASPAPTSLTPSTASAPSCPYLEAAMPSGINTTLVMDRTTTIRASVFNVERTLVFSVILVVLVVFLFLRSPRATLIPAVAVPVSLIGTFAVMYLFGFSLDNLSLMALTVATGFVVDDAIVVMENITRHLEAGMEPFAAAYRGAREIGFTVFSISMSLIAVFIPILHHGRHRRPAFPRVRRRSFHRHPGLDGRLPHHHSHHVRPPAQGAPRSMSATTGSTRIQRKGLQHRHLASTAVRCAGSSTTPPSCSSFSCLPSPSTSSSSYRIPKGFFPQQDTGAIFGGVQGPQDASFPFMNFSMQKIVDIIKADPAVPTSTPTPAAAVPPTAALFTCRSSPCRHVRQTLQGRPQLRLPPDLRTWT